MALPRIKKPTPRHFTFSEQHINRSNGKPLLHSWDYSTPHREKDPDSTVCSELELKKKIEKEKKVAPLENILNGLSSLNLFSSTITSQALNTVVSNPIVCLLDEKKITNLNNR